jgi:hypothetical protein
VNLFSSAARPAPAGGGLEILRQAVRSRKLGLAGIGRELGIGTHQLEAFISGGTLPIDQLNAIAGLVWGSGVSYDPETDLLRRAPQPASSPPFATVRSPSASEMNLPRDHLAPRVLPKTPPQPPARISRPGWSD